MCTPANVARRSCASRCGFGATAASGSSPSMAMGSRGRLRCYGASGEDKAPSSLTQPMECPMPHANDLSRCLAPVEQDCTIIAVIEMRQSSWLVAGIVPGIERQPLKKLEPDKSALLRLLHRWRNEATTAGRTVTRIAVAFEADRDGFWLSRW